jgi:hypothetical protein
MNARRVLRNASWSSLKIVRRIGHLLLLKTGDCPPA